MLKKLKIPQNLKKKIMPVRRLLKYDDKNIIDFQVID